VPSTVDEPAEQVSLVGEDGREIVFTLHDAFDLDGEVYYLVESGEDPEQVLLLKSVGEDLEALAGDEFDRVIERLEAAEAQGEGGAAPEPAG